MSDLILGLSCIFFVLTFVALVIWSIYFAFRRKVYDREFLDKVTTNLNALSEEPESLHLRDTLIQSCEDIRQSYSLPILGGITILNCDPVDAVFGLLMLKDTGEQKGEIPVELFRKLREVNGKPFPLSNFDCVSVAVLAEKYFPDYPDHESNNYRLRVRIKGWKGLSIPSPVTHQPTPTSPNAPDQLTQAPPAGTANPHGEYPQWLFPGRLLGTPQSAFDFPEYPGLSVAMRLYIVVGKISWWLAVLSNWGSYFLIVVISFADPEYPLRGVFFAFVLLPLVLLIQLLSNLGLAFVFGSCEIVKVLVRIEKNTRREIVKDGGASDGESSG